MESDRDTFAEAEGTLQSPGPGLSENASGGILKSPIDVLTALAEEWEETLDFKFIDMDTGTLDEAIYVDCTLTAGKFVIKALAPSISLAKVFAAQQCLDQIKETLPTFNIPDWKRVPSANACLDPVMLLMNYSRDKGLGAPSFSCSKFKDEGSGQAQYAYTCVLGRIRAQVFGANAYYAQRRAAFEVLDQLAGAKSEVGGGMEAATSEAAPAGTFVSVDPSYVKNLEENASLMIEFDPKPSCFPITTKSGIEPGEPDIRVRYGMKPRTSVDSDDIDSGANKLRCTTEYQFTFTSFGESLDEAITKCMESAERYANVLAEECPLGNIGPMVSNAD